MIDKLRRNTIMRDWHNAMDHHYFITGYDPQYVSMNIKTLQYMIEYLNKNPKYGYMNIRRNYIDARDRYGYMAAQFLNDVYIEFRGVKITIDSCLEDEMIKVS